jgi:thiol-disulfide isomerase/thioredoxin
MKTKPLFFAALLGLAAAVDAPAQDSAVLKRMDGATGWLNSAPLGAAELRGKVVLVDFWTYTCINWIRQLPYVRAWAEKYGDQGLVVIGVHTPEFEFEKNVDNVRRAVHDMRVAYPVAIDSDYAVWRAFGNNAWPAIYLIDAQGRVRYRHLGEGEYDRTERMIQQLLAETGKAAAGRDLVAAEGRGVEAPADWASLRSPENYVGVERTENFVSPGGPVVGKPRPYAAPARLAVNHWALAGDWTMQKHAIVLNKPNGRIVYRFHARDLHLVMGPAARGAAVRFRVLIDGKPPGAAHGIDIDEQGNGRVTEQRMCQLIRQPGPIVDRQFEIEFVDPAVEAFAFTFG